MNSLIKHIQCFILTAFVAINAPLTLDDVRKTREQDTFVLPSDGIAVPNEEVYAITFMPENAQNGAVIYVSSESIKGIDLSQDKGKIYNLIIEKLGDRPISEVLLFWAKRSIETIYSRDISTSSFGFIKLYPNIGRVKLEGHASLAFWQAPMNFREFIETKLPGILNEANQFVTDKQAKVTKQDLAELRPSKDAVEFLKADMRISQREGATPEELVANFRAAASVCFGLEKTPSSLYPDIEFMTHVRRN